MTRTIPRPHAPRRRLAATALALAFAPALLAAQEADEAPVTWPGMDRSGTVLLPNGWSLKPAGRQEALGGDLPVLIARHPAEPVLAILFAGYGDA